MNNALKQLSHLPYFRISHLELSLPRIKKNSLYRNITRWSNKGIIIKLKKSYYVTNEYAEKHRAKKEYFYYLANALRYPSYVSGIYMLQHYNILTEITYPITSITTKSTRIYTNHLGKFVYHSITPPLYIGYKRFLYYNEPIYIATKAKALFDYLYIKYNKTKITAHDVVARERLNLEDFTSVDKEEFIKYCAIAKKPIIVESLKFLYNETLTK